METDKPIDVASPHEADLTDNNIQQLLLEAENRLRTIATHSEHPSPRVPQLSHDCVQQSYIRQDDIVTTDPARVNDNLKKSTSTLPHPAQDSPAEKTKPKQRLMQLHQSVLDCAVPMRVLFFIVTLSIINKASMVHRNMVWIGLTSVSIIKEKQTAGADWFNLPKTELTPELKRDLQILRMRSVLDPKRHYKKENGKVQPPQYSQIGTIIEGPGEFFSGRITKKDRKKTFVEEVLASERESRRFESKYQGIQATKKSGKGEYYKNLRAKRHMKGK
ncbi:Fcf2 domain-containing protein [Aspergillus affinis]|uniref:Fcf2 domain-containing protein n=1 Tax=Aspergillus affinis TaxID=1070780 RepID=UPI0022FE1536|nr:Fcf2-domain-containing protein [Aspergillus affinis]KAI9040876.1 Fcf2-domain-containing protein [Aspergillus affinis]